MPLLTLFPNLDIKLPASELTEPQRLLFDILLYLLLSQNTIFCSSEKKWKWEMVCFYIVLSIVVFSILKMMIE